MFRRRFLKAMIAGIGSALLWPFKVAEAISAPVVPLGIGIMDPEIMKRICNTVPQVPFLPTLEWLREREPRITAIEVNYREGRFARSGQREWKCFIFKEYSSDPAYSHTVVALENAGGAWAVQQDTEKSGCPADTSYKPKWPDWLRKF